MTKRAPDPAKAAAVLGSRGGKANTAAQAKARAENGKSGGRPLANPTADQLTYAAEILRSRHTQALLAKVPEADAGLDVVAKFLHRKSIRRADGKQI